MDTVCAWRQYVHGHPTDLGVQMTEKLQMDTWALTRTYTPLSQLMAMWKSAQELITQVHHRRHVCQSLQLMTPPTGSCCSNALTLSV